MRARVAVIDVAARAAIRALAASADAARVDAGAMRLIMAGQRPPVGDDPAFSLTVGGVYRCVFSVEEHPAGWCRHLSVSIIDPNAARPLPSVEAVQALARDFGFRADLIGGTLDGRLWIEENRAVNIVERMAASP